MSSTLTIAASIWRSDNTKAVTVAELSSAASNVAADEIDTVTIAASGSYTAQFNQISNAAEFVLVISTETLDIELNGNSSIQSKTLHLTGGNISSLVITNTSADNAAIVRLILGGD